MPSFSILWSINGAVPIKLIAFSVLIIVTKTLTQSRFFRRSLFNWIQAWNFLLDPLFLVNSRYCFCIGIQNVLTKFSYWIPIFGEITDLWEFFINFFDMVDFGFKNFYCPVKEYRRNNASILRTSHAFCRRSNSPIFQCKVNDLLVCFNDSWSSKFLKNLPYLIILLILILYWYMPLSW